MTIPPYIFAAGGAVVVAVAVVVFLVEWVGRQQQKSMQGY